MAFQDKVISNRWQVRKTKSVSGKREKLVLEVGAPGRKKNWGKAPAGRRLSRPRRPSRKSWKVKMATAKKRMSQWCISCILLASDTHRPLSTSRTRHGLIAFANPTSRCRRPRRRRRRWCTSIPSVITTIAGPVGSGLPLWCWLLATAATFM